MGGAHNMKLLFDQNLSHRLVKLLAEEFPGSVHVRELGLAAAADPVVWSFARENDFLIASKDADFQQCALLLGCPPKVIWAKLGELFDGCHRKAFTFPNEGSYRIRIRPQSIVSGDCILGVGVDGAVARGA